MSATNGAQKKNGKPPLELIEPPRVPALAPEASNVAAEQAVLAAALLNNDSLASVEGRGLAPEDFYRPEYAAMYASMLDLQRGGTGVSPLTLERELKRRGELKKVGGLQAIQVVEGLLDVTTHATDHADLVMEAAALRRRRYALLNALEHLDDERVQADLTTVLDEADPRLRAQDDCELDLSALMSRPRKPIKWRCQGLLVDGHVTILVGRSGEKKSFFSLALALGVLEGRTVAGIECALGNVTIFDGEQSEDLVEDRLHSTQLPLGGLRWFLTHKQGKDLRYHERWFIQKGQGANLIIFDSLRRLAPGARENESDDMAPVMAALQRIATKTGAAVLVIHHRSSKAESADFRGSSAIGDQVDMVFSFEKEKSDPAAEWRRSVKTLKCRVARDPATRWIGVKPVADDRVIFTEAEPYQPDAAERPVRDELSDEILRLIIDQGPVSRPNIARALGRVRNDTSVRRVFKELIEDGLILEVSGKPPTYVPAEGAAAELAPPGTLARESVDTEGATQEGDGTLARPLEGMEDAGG